MSEMPRIPVAYAVSVPLLNICTGFCLTVLDFKVKSAVYVLETILHRGIHFSRLRCKTCKVSHYLG